MIARRRPTTRAEPRRLVCKCWQTPRCPPAPIACWPAQPGRKIEAVTKAVEALLADALRLSPEVRAELAAELLASLHGPADPEAEAGWAAEIERRVDAIESGSVSLEPWEDVKRRIEKNILGR